MNDDKLKELINFTKSLRSITEISDSTTKAFVQSLDYLETRITSCHIGIAETFSQIELKKKRIENLSFTVSELEVFLKLIDVIDNDKLSIMQGHRGLFEEYIKNLEYINTILEKYEWLKDLIYVSPASTSTGSSSLVVNVLTKASQKISNFQAYYNKYTVLMRHGENLLSQEFYDVLQHYSNLENMKNFIDFIISKKDETENGTIENIDDYALFIPKETITKLEHICWWFLRREQQYELYDEKNQHCDIIKKLKYNEKRNGYLKICLITYSKMNSLGFKKDAHDKIKKINKLYHAAINDSINNSSGSSHHHSSSKKEDEHKLKEFFKDIQQQQTSINAEDENDSRKSSKPVDYIEVFADNLDFSLKLMKHENFLIKSIFLRSDDTSIELISILTILIMDQLKEEFERFFKNSCDFNKSSNNGEDVVEAIIRLIIKVFNLKEKTTCLQTKDLSSASKLLQFSIRLNEIGSQIFRTYLDVIETGVYNTYDIPYNCSLHEYLIKASNVMRNINENEKYLLDSIKLCSNLLINESNKSKNKEKLDIENDKDQNNNDDDENDIDPMELYQRCARGGGRKLNLDLQGLNELQEIKPNLNEASDNEEDFEKSTKSHFARYFVHFIESLVKFINQEATKSMLSSHSLLYSTSLMSFTGSSSSLASFPLLSNSNSISSNFISNIKTYKANVFLINNQNYLIDFIQNELKIKDIITKLNINGNIINTLNRNIAHNVDKSFDLFKYIQTKWSKVIAEGIYIEGDETIYSNNENGIKNENEYNARRTFKFMDPKRKRKEEFGRIIKESIDICSKCVILHDKTSEIFREKAKTVLNPIFQTLESSGDLSEIVLALNIRSNQLNEYNNIKDLLYNKMFPYSQ